MKLYDVLSDPRRLASLSTGAIVRARDFLLHDQVLRLYAQAEAHMRLVAAP